MSRLGRILVALAFAAWSGTAVSQVVGGRASAQSERIEWTERRNLFLLCSSLSTNALAFHTLYRFLRARRTEQ